MNVIATEIPDVLLIEPKVFTDSRGYFYESYNKQSFKDIGLIDKFVQDNQSMSHKNTLRGLHFQVPPFAQGKLVRAVRGAIFDVAVDIRKGSPWYGKWVGCKLSEENKLMLWIPSGFAHGFAVLEDDTLVNYKCTQLYDRDSERSIRWNDPELSIDWGITDPLLSEKDKAVPFLADFETPFIYVDGK